MTTLSINYQFSPVPLTLKEMLYKLNLGNSEHKTLDLIMSEIFLYPSSRQTKIKELSCRFLAEKLNLHFATVARAVKNLVKKGYIEFVKVSKKKGEGSLIRLLLGGKAENDNQLRSYATDQEKISCTRGDNTRSTIQKIKQQHKVDVDSSLKLNSEEKIIEEKNLLLSSLPLEIQKDKALMHNESNNDVKVLKFTPAPENLQDLHIQGVKNKVLFKGIKKLKERGIQEIEKAVNVIRGIIENKGSKIMSRAAYYMTLCTDIDINEPVPSVLDISPVTHSDDNPATPPVRINYNRLAAPQMERKTVAPSIVQTQSYLKAIEEEKITEKKPEEVLQEIMKNDPDLIYQVIQDVDNDKKNRFVTLEDIKFSLYIDEYRKRKGDLLKNVSV